VFQFLRSVGLTPLEWVSVVSATGKTSPYVGEILDSAFSAAQAVVVLLGPEDEARLMESLVQANDPPHEKLLTPQARPNVLFEAGMAMGRYPGRTVLVEVGDLRPFSDIAGMHTIKLNNSSQRRQEFASRLQTAGCPVDLSGTDWHTAGDFTAHSPGNR
jgi:predicted nucleotide-binding protein